MQSNPARSRFYELRAVGLFIASYKPPRAVRGRFKALDKLREVFVYPLLSGEMDDIYEAFLTNLVNDPEAHAFIADVEGEETRNFT